MKTNKSVQSLLTILVLMGVLTIVPVMSASAYELSITSNNLNTMNSFTYSGAWYNVGPNSYLLKWYGGGEYFEPPFKAPAYYQGIITATTMADYKGYYWGECVSMVKNLAHSTVQTKDWSRGRHVVDGGISPGTAIATFYWNSEEGKYKYSGHAAIFRQYIKNSYGHITGIMVWDQNYVFNDLVGMHIIPITGAGGVTDANSYYVVNV